MFQFLGNIDHALEKLKATKEAATGVVGTSSGWVTGVPATPKRRMSYAQSQVIYSQPMFSARFILLRTGRYHRDAGTSTSGSGSGQRTSQK